MIKSILFTHTDLDGAGCAVLFKYLCNHRDMTEGEDYLIFTVDISRLYETVTTTIESYDVNEDTEIIFADLCCGEVLMKRLVERFKTIRVFDHHLTNYWVNDFPGIDAHVYERNPDGGLESGTSILWTFYRNELNNLAIIKFTNAVRSYDNFEFKTIPNEDAVKLNKLFSILGMEAFRVAYSDCIGTGDIIQVSRGKPEFMYVSDEANHIRVWNVEIMDATLEFVVDSVLKLEREKIQRIVEGTDKRGYICFDYVSPSGLKYIIFNVVLGINMSELAAQYLSAHTEYDAFCWYDINRKAFSFRATRDDVDVSVIAALLGGGGHPKASGSLIPQKTYQKLIDDVSSTISEGLKDIESK